MLYAAYGSNLHPIRLTQRITSAALVATAFLPKWSLRFHKRSKDDSGKCNIVRGSDGVRVAIFDVSIEDKRTLDQIEGVGFGYAEALLQVPGIGECHTYVAEEGYVDEALRPYDWYRELVLGGARFHGFPQDYLKAIESIGAWPDPDAHRSAREWQTVDRFRTAGA